MPSPNSKASPDGTTTSYEPSAWFWQTRAKGAALSGTITFVALRALDVPLQLWFLRSGAGAGVLRTLGATPVTQTTVATRVLGLSPYHALIFGLACGSSAKQIYWKLAIGDTVLPASFAAVISGYNTVLNSFNTVLALWALTTQQPGEQDSVGAFWRTAPVTLKLGLVLYSTGLFTEWWCEIQRKAFKQDPRNKGKPYSGGLFGLARNINYGGYTMWRAGYSLMCGGWIWGGIMCSWLAGDFIGRAIPSMDAYCQKRYGAQWDEVRRKVPYKLLPWVY